MEGCAYCKEQKVKMLKNEDEIKKETMMECKKALEREKIAKGMQSTRLDEMELRAMQKLQIEEKKYIEGEEEFVERLWHQVLLDDVKKKEEEERKRALRLREEMHDRRKSYDQQILSAKKERQETLQREREQENRRLEKVKQRMEEDYCNALKRKQEQQTTNRSNFIAGHQMKLSRLEHEKNKERAVDVDCIRAAIEELRQEKQHEIDKMRVLKQQETIFVNCHQREKKMAIALEEDAHKIIQEWSTASDKEYKEHLRREEITKTINKEKAFAGYKKHLEDIKQQITREKLELREKMEKVKRTAYLELERRLNSAKEELKKQNEYRNNLTEQIRQNQRVSETKLKNVECKQQAFTKDAITFKEAMRDKINIRNGGESTNPVHPFHQVIKMHEKYGRPMLPNL